MLKMLKMLKLNYVFIFIFVISVAGAAAAADCNELTNDIAKNSYLLNLMRVNEKLCEENTYIFPEKEAVGYFRVVRGWAKNNTQSKKLYLWYDSKHVTKKQIENTKKRICDKHDAGYRADSEFVNQYDAQHNGEFAKIKEDLVCTVICRDIRELPLVQENEDIFSEKMSIYFRVDLLRVIVADHLVKSESETGYIVYSDFNIPWMSHDKLFQPREYEHHSGYYNIEENTVKDLNEIGLVLAENNKFSLSRSFPYENGFFILNSTNEAMIKACRLGLIDINILRAKHSIQMGTYLQDREGQQCVFSSYSNVIKIYYYYNLTGKIIEDPYGNPDTKSERLSGYHNCTDLFELDKAQKAKFKIEVMLKDIFGQEFAKVYEEGKSMAELLKTKQVEKPISSFYTNLDGKETKRRQRDNERLKYIGILQ